MFVRPGRAIAPLFLLCSSLIDFLEECVVCCRDCKTPYGKKTQKQKTLLVMFTCINKADLTRCSHLSIHSDETLLIVSQVFNAVARVTMQHSI